MEKTIETLIKRWLNVLDEASQLNKQVDFHKTINYVKREMRYALKIMEQQEGKKDDD